MTKISWCGQEGLHYVHLFIKRHLGTDVEFKCLGVTL